MSYRIENIAPILYVEDMPRSVTFYTEVLGFTNAEWGDDTFTCVDRNDSGIYLCRRGQGAPGTWIWVGFDGDIKALHKHVESLGATIRMPPTNFPWAYEMHVVDPDGNVLRFGTDPDESVPFADPTLMYS